MNTETSSLDKTFWRHLPVYNRSRKTSLKWFTTIPNATARRFGDPVAGITERVPFLSIHALPSPEDVYVLDLCECDQEIRLMELNPFSGADLYACDGPTIVDAISEMLQKSEM